jgi:hypothetical protein
LAGAILDVCGCWRFPFMNGRLALPLPPAAASTSCGQPRVEGTTKRAMNFPLIINR